jgi:hypothetical protein
MGLGSCLGVYLSYIFRDERQRSYWGSGMRLLPDNRKGLLRADEYGTSPVQELLRYKVQRQRHASPGGASLPSAFLMIAHNRIRVKGMKTRITYP